MLTPRMGKSPMMDQLPVSVEVTRDSTHDIEERIRKAQMPASIAKLKSLAAQSIQSIKARGEPLNKIFRLPEEQDGSPEMLILRFDKQTCGILSVKDGPTENPWRTLILPLAKDSPALYHAIAYMAAVHASKENPSLQVIGMEHMRRSIICLRSGISEMHTDTAFATLATTLVLAISESWDQPIGTKIEHLRGAGILIRQTLVSHKISDFSGDDLARLEFLCNTWIYMDVNARLTSVEVDEEDTDFDEALAPLNFSMSPTNTCIKIDPLLGCADTLFPLIRKSTILCKKSMNIETYSTAFIKDAIELHNAIESWSPPPGSAFERPEDPTCEIQHALQTAEAYRYATLLYMRKALSQDTSFTSMQLSQKVLGSLAAVPLSSRLVIVHIYPLLVAGCEARGQGERNWVEDRWKSLAMRMRTSNIDRYLEITQEVWSWRDTFEQESLSRERSLSWSVSQEKENEPIGGRQAAQHEGSWPCKEPSIMGNWPWLKVMKDWEFHRPPI
jgi:hypothetical protein